MRIEEISPEDYAARFPHPPHIFNSVEFTELNRHKVSGLHYLILQDTRTRGAIILGRRDNMLLSPFSAPYGWLTMNRRAGAALVHEMHLSLIDYARQQGMSLRLGLPPMWHDPSLLSCAVQSLSRIDDGSLSFDLNYHLPLYHNVGLVDLCSSAGRGAMRRALESPLSFGPLPLNAENIGICYDVAARNHQERGYPVRMSRDDMISTALSVRAQLFAVRDHTDYVASAIVYDVRPRTAQPVLWGHLSEYQHLHPMHRMALGMYDFYRGLGYETIDLGPATENGTPNGGLALFKESIGCQTSLKSSFTINM